MNDPIDQRFVDYIVGRLQLIRIDDGYRTDAGMHVIDEEDRTDIPTDAIVLVVLDTDERLDQQKLRTRSAELVVRVIAYVPDGDETGARRTGRKVLADIRQAIASAPCGATPTGVTELSIGGRSLPVRAEGGGVQTASMEIIATLHERHTP